MIYLHIGYPKTGTTTLQAFLGRNRDGLARAGVQFPRSLLRGRAHHDIALALSPTRSRQISDRAKSTVAAELERMRELVASGDDLIVSSEMFQQSDPRLVATLFPPGRTRIIVYVRDQLAYVVSAYAQRIQATLDSTPFTRFAARFDPEYLQLLDNWAGVFGSGNLDVGIYDRSQLVDNDIRVDFLTRLGIDPNQFDYELGKRQKGNPTIGPELLEFKGVLNALVPEPVQRELLMFDNLAAIAPKFSRLRTSQGFADIYRRRFDASNDAVRTRYFDSRTFPKCGRSGPGSVVDRDEAIDRSMAALAEVAPDAADRLGGYLKKDQIAKARPLVPHDWRLAERELERSLAPSRLRPEGRRARAAKDAR